MTPLTRSRPRPTTTSSTSRMTTSSTSRMTTSTWPAMPTARCRKPSCTHPRNSSLSNLRANYVPVALYSLSSSIHFTTTWYASWTTQQQFNIVDQCNNFLYIPVNWSVRLFPPYILFMSRINNWRHCQQETYKMYKEFSITSRCLDI